MEQSGKKSLYKAMEERGFFNDAHEIAVSTALQDGNMKLLKHYWEEVVLCKVLEFRDHVKGILGDEEKPANGDVKEGTGGNLLKCELTNKQIALVCFYRKIPVNNELKALEIFKEFGSNNISGKKLYNVYQNIENDADRLGSSGKDKSDQYKIKDLKKVIAYFNENQGKVPDELLADFKLLKENVEKYRYNK